eukprot:scaffold7500_cov127-Isochrysis_galbana.AAC.26
MIAYCQAALRNSSRIKSGPSSALSLVHSSWCATLSTESSVKGARPLIQRPFLPACSVGYASLGASEAMATRSCFETETRMPPRPRPEATPVGMEVHALAAQRLARHRLLVPTLARFALLADFEGVDTTKGDAARHAGVRQRGVDSDRRSVPGLRGGLLVVADHALHEEEPIP